MDSQPTRRHVERCARVGELCPCSIKCGSIGVDHCLTVRQLGDNPTSTGATAQLSGAELYHEAVWPSLGVDGSCAPVDHAVDGLALGIMLMQGIEHWCTLGLVVHGPRVAADEVILWCKCRPPLKSMSSAPFGAKQHWMGMLGGCKASSRSDRARAST